MKKSFILHPFLFTLSSVLFSYSYAMLYSSPSQIIRPLIFLWLILLITMFILNKVMHEWNWTGLLLTIFVFCFFVSIKFFSSIFTFIVFSVLSWIIALFLLKRGVKIRQITQLLNILALLVLFISFYRINTYFSRIELEKDWGITTSSNVITLDSNVGSKPDIYFIVLDAYARNDILKEYYQFENAEFIENLRSNDFIVPENMHSNYPRTVLSLSSTLNMDYVQAITPTYFQESFFRWLVDPLMDHSLLRNSLEQIGYKTIDITTQPSTTGEFTSKPYPYIVNLNDFEGYLLRTTPLKLLTPVFSLFSDVPSYNTQRTLVNYYFDKLSDISSYPGPKFVFAHILSPHPPFVFDRNGFPITPDYPFQLSDASDYPGASEQYRDGYVSQLNYVNHRVLQIVDDILANSRTPPIIILQADHGPGKMTDFNSAENTCLQERFSVFAAYYLPGMDAISIPDEISSVNIFRIILNQYFAADLPLLDNRYYFPNNLYVFSNNDVTDRLYDICLMGESSK